MLNFPVLSHVSNKRVYGIFGQGSKSEVNTVIRKARNNHQIIFETFDILAAAARPPHKICPHWEEEVTRNADMVLGGCMISLFWCWILFPNFADIIKGGPFVHTQSDEVQIFLTPFNTSQLRYVTDRISLRFTQTTVNS